MSRIKPRGKICVHLWFSPFFFGGMGSGEEFSTTDSHGFSRILERWGSVGEIFSRIEEAFQRIRADDGG
jgi:hypothetical protein